MDKFLERVNKPFNVELPEANSLDEYLDIIIPTVKAWSEDLNEDEYFLEKAWVEFRDQEDFHQTIIHIFNEESEYLKVTDGDVKQGNWTHLETSNKFLIVDKDSDADAEMYDLAYLDDNFFILKKHGFNENLRKKGRKKYFVLVSESESGKLNRDWMQAVELLFTNYRSQNRIYLTIAGIIVLIVGIILVLSLG